ncbi:LysE family translocator [Thalassobaculum sp. OXR-137]|uniref:LysE family translocator n=1 Tax=Thalassobaculum sp. OXR-137 TaxID=3100173 RepID=UPI002AC9B6A0|nr:LysE family translocator [Thalassobaculum sp. OXR-137]WPZ36367.1 LysE family translocator [Thalassobaculum sp. OXR-137]
MPIDLWLAFVTASVAILLLPGPTTMLIVGYALGDGRRAAFGAVGGVLAGDLAALAISAVGLGAILASSAVVFTVMKFAGAAYLIWLGVKMWRAPVDPHAVDAAQAGAVADRSKGRRRALHGFVVTALNPKLIAFFIAFLPQFMTPHAPVLPQLLVLAPTFLGVSVITNSLYVLAASAARTRLRSPAALRTVNRVGAGCLIGAGVLTAALRRT